MNMSFSALAYPHACWFRGNQLRVVPLCAALLVVANSANAAPALQLTKPGIGQSFTPGANIALEAVVTNDGTAITRVEFYADNLLLGIGVPDVHGEWQYADGSHLSLMNGLFGEMADYTTPAFVWYGIEGTYSSPTNFTGTFTTFVSGAPVSGKAAIQLTLSAEGRLTAVFSADAPLGNPALTNGQRMSLEEIHGFAWTTVPAGNYILKARAIFGIGQSVDSPGVNIIVGSAAPAPPTIVAEVSGAQLSFTWLSQPNVRYQLQSTTNLPPTVWADEGVPLVGTGSLMTNNAAIGTDPGKFFRLQVIGD